ncbi:MAG: cellulase family glycosylhydrolase [Cyclobacteriaceae bacterium]|nr:cellulase family glycosylhydrolase [Cyclobacteriaceae bacterium]
MKNPVKYCCKVALSLIAISFFMSCGKISDNAAEEAFSIQRGINISHWLSQSKRRGEERKNFFLEKDVEYIAGLGFDHIRIPIDEEQMWNEEGEKEADAFTLLHNALNWSQKAGLRVVVDLHILRSHHFNEGEKPLWTETAAQERFFQCWRDLSEEFQKYPVSMIAYELMNEPVADDPEDWNRLVAKAVEVIRTKEPLRKIVIGSNRWQNASTFDVLKVPDNDPNIILSFHMYEPMLITHYKASWTGLRDYDGPVNYPGVIVSEEEIANQPEEIAAMLRRQDLFYDYNTIVRHFEKPLQVAKAYGLPLYCGEWGVLPTIGDEERYQWYRDVIEILEKNDIAWATWDYKGGFGILRNGVEDLKLIEILTGYKN